MGASNPSNSGRGERRGVRTYDGMQPELHVKRVEFGRRIELGGEELREWFKSGR